MSSADFIRYQMPPLLGPSRQLEALAVAPGAGKSALFLKKRAGWLKRTGIDALDQRFARRVDRLSDKLGPIDRDGHLELESPALFIPNRLTLNAPVAEHRESARADGPERFGAFFERVGRQLADGRLSFPSRDGR